MTTEFQSISKGVFVVPYRAPSDDGGSDQEPEAGPSRPTKRSLKGWYDTAYEEFSTALAEYESQRTEEQLEDIADWLEGCTSAESGGLQFVFETRRLPVGIMQDTSPSLTELLGKVVNHRAVLLGREVVDCNAGIRGVALGLMDDNAMLGKAGRSGMDEVNRWFSSLPTGKQTPILVHVQDAQLVPSHVLSELVYVLSLRPSLPVRVLMSVPSVSAFVGSLSHIEPSGVEVNILGLGAKRAAEGGVAAVLRAGKSESASKLHLGADLIGDLEEEEQMFGGGAVSALKSLRWRLLYHCVNSPLATLVDEDEQMLTRVEAVLRGETDGADLSELLEIGSGREAQATLNPAPRVSVLHALSTSAAYIERLPKLRGKGPAGRANQPEPTVTREEPAASPRSAKRRRSNRTIRSPEDDAIPPSPAPLPPTDDGHAATSDPDQRGDLKELEVLFSLWRSAGRNVNLWDWLEGFRGSMMGPGGQESNGKTAAPPRDAEVDVEARDDGEAPGRITDSSAGGALAEAPRSAQEEELAEEESAARLHAVFVRFCEEARMLGLVRARGRAKRADEVVKSIGLV